ncbi:MAG: hypothetical protein WKF67_15035 [Rubrobacteraceae bacterium]
MKKNQVDWHERFAHNGKNYTIMGQNLNMGTERFVLGSLRGIRPDYAVAEWNLINSSILKLLCDGTTVWKKGDDIEKLPSEYDSKTERTTGEQVLRVLVTRRFPYLADRHEEPFGDYYDEDEITGEGDGPDVDSGPDGNSPKPTPITHAEFTG